MNRRTERVASRIREILGQILLSKIADPRIDPALTSVTRVELPDDLLTAKVYISVIGDESRQKLTLQALRHAQGHLQELMMRQISLRNTPLLHFVSDTQFKKTLATLQLIDQAMDEIRQKEQASAAAGPDQPPDASAPPADE